VRGRTEAVLPTGTVTKAGDGNGLNTAEHRETGMDSAAPRQLAQASNATHLPC
jgi:hypothetical protein